MSKGDTQITASFSASIISCIAQLIIASVWSLDFLRFQKSDGSVINVCHNGATKALSFIEQSLAKFQDSLAHFRIQRVPGVSHMCPKSLQVSSVSTVWHLLSVISDSQNDSPDVITDISVQARYFHPNCLF